MWENLRARFGRMGLLLFVGLIVLFGLALTIFAVQQGAKQSELKAQIDKISLTLIRPLPSAAKLKAEYDEATLAIPRLFTGPLGPWWGLQHEAANPSAIQLPEREAVDIIVRLARDSGIDIAASGMLTIPPNSPPGNAKVGDGSYGVLSINNIQATGDYDKVIAFISRLESGAALKTMALKSVALSWVQIPDKKDAARAAELEMVSAAVRAMMADNGLTGVPNPTTGVAVNVMGDDPATVNVVEGFPDTSTLAASELKVYTGYLPNPKNGYVLYRHDRIDRVDTTKFTTVDYFFNEKGEPVLKTEYYYIADQDGKVRQFDGPDIAAATEYGPDVKVLTLTAATLNVDIYTTPLPKPETKPQAKPR